METPLHIAYLAPGWPPGRFANGITTYVGHQRRELQALGAQVSVFTNQQSPEAREDEGVLPVRRTWAMRLRARLRDGDAAATPLRWSEAIAAAVRRRHAERPIDLLEMEESFGWCADVQARLPLPVLVKLHGPAFLTQPTEDADALALRIDAEGRALARMRHLCAPAAATLRATHVRYGLATPGHVLRNPIAADPALPLWSAARAQRATLLFVGRFDRVKGGDFLLDAFARLRMCRPGLRLVFVGPDIGIAGADGRRVPLADHAQRLLGDGWREIVQATGALPRERIEALRCDAAAVLVCSRWENQPATALEAMLQGCPLLSTDAGGMPELIEHGVTGLLYRAGDIEDFCARAGELLDDPVRAAALGAAARAHVRRAHDPRRLAEQALTLYRRLRSGVPETVT
jgi:glycosyltransferase involved in cell wall biosynthesis